MIRNKTLLFFFTLLRSEDFVKKIKQFKNLTGFFLLTLPRLPRHEKQMIGKKGLRIFFIYFFHSIVKCVVGQVKE